MIVNQFTKAEMTSQSRAMKFIFFYAFSFSFFQVSERNRHQISVSPTSQTDHRSFFVFFSVMFFSSVASPTSIFQSQKESQPRFKIRGFRSKTDAVQSSETEFSADAGSSSSSNIQLRSRKEVQTINIFAVRVLLADLVKGCSCKNGIQWEITED